MRQLVTLTLCLLLIPLLARGAPPGRALEPVEAREYDGGWGRKGVQLTFKRLPPDRDQVPLTRDDVRAIREAFEAVYGKQEPLPPPQYPSGTRVASVGAQYVSTGAPEWQEKIRKEYEELYGTGQSAHALPINLERSRFFQALRLSPQYMGEGAREAAMELKAMNMPGRYYELYSDMHVPGRWYMRSPLNAEGERIIPWEFLQEKPVCLGVEPFLPLSHSGRALDFTQTEVGIAVVSQRFVSLCEQMGVQHDVQFIPARVESEPERYFILNTLRIIRCVDEARCREVTFFEPRHGIPEKVGHYSNVRGLKIDPTKVGDANIFRPWGWTVVLIVSERVKLAMEERGLTGAKFIEV